MAGVRLALVGETYHARRSARDPEWWDALIASAIESERRRVNDPVGSNYRHALAGSVTPTMERRELLGWPMWVGVVVDDLERQRRFWGDLLGLPETAAGSDYVQFDMGEGRIFELVQRSELPQYDDLRFQVGFAVEDIGEARAELVRAGVEPLSEIEGEESTWAYFRDPEGNVFEITKRSGSVESSTELG